MSSSFKRFLVVSLSTILFMPQIAIGQSGKGGSQGEWDKTVDLAKKEGRVVVSIPASPELRIAIEKSFERKRTQPTMTSRNMPTCRIDAGRGSQYAANRR